MEILRPAGGIALEMPNPKTTQRAKKDLRQGKKPSTAAGEFVKEEIEHVRQGKHGVRSPQQAIAIGLNEARRAGIPVKPPKRGTTKASTRRSAERAYKKGQSGAKKPSARASRTRERVLQREPTSTVSHKALSQQAKSAAAKRRKSGPRRARPASRAA